MKNFPTVHTEVTGHMKRTVSLKDTEINLNTKEKTTVYTSDRVTFAVTNLFTLMCVQYLEVNKNEKNKSNLYVSK
jgi:hypothetical protein